MGGIAAFVLSIGAKGKESSHWVHTMRDVQPQKFVNVDGQTYIVGVEDPPIQDVTWEAQRNTKWWKVEKTICRNTVGLLNLLC